MSLEKLFPHGGRAFPHLCAVVKQHCGDRPDAEFMDRQLPREVSVIEIAASCRRSFAIVTKAVATSGVKLS